jgi:4-carboxymuconolactone decarboxylase
MNDEERHDAGLQVRREVLGAEYVDRAAANADPFTQDLQDYLNKFCWGVAWTRTGLDRRTRSLITLAILGATGKTTEIKTHTLGALRNGCTPEEIKEVFLHLATYVGVPSTVDAFRAAQPVVAEHSKA